MRLMKKASLAAVAALAAAGIAAPLSLAGAETTASSRAVAAADPDLLLPAPENPRVSDGPYAGFQSCAAPQRPLVTSGSPTLAATLEAVAPPGTVEKPGDHARPGRQVVYEIEQADGKRVLRKQFLTDSARNANYQVPRGTLTSGDYRWRVRVQDGPADAPWTAWCGFTVRLG
ncbi:hypothetical protein AB0H29_16060 [Streptomyces thermolilacinus]